MDRRLALVALWAAFAVASVGVGFGAAGLVGGPFSDGVADAAPVGASQEPTETATARSPGPEPSSSSSPSPGPDSTRPATTKGPDPASTAEPSRTSEASGPSPRPARAVTRSITTEGGLVSATCRSGLVEVSGSPAVGWEIEDIDGGARRDARVRFERPDGEGRVEVEATCSRGAPRFALDVDEEGGGGDDGHGDGSGGGGGEDD